MYEICHTDTTSYMNLELDEQLLIAAEESNKEILDHFHLLEHPSHHSRKGEAICGIRGMVGAREV